VVCCSIRCAMMLHQGKFGMPCKLCFRSLAQNESHSGFGSVPVKCRLLASVCNPSCHPDGGMHRCSAGGVRTCGCLVTFAPAA
jgi:hypothetical protein